ISAVGVSPVTRSKASFVGSTGGDHSPLRQPKPRSQRPSGTEGATAATRATASSSDRAPSSRTSRRATDQVGKWTCASLKPGRTQRPPRSTRSGPGNAVSCVPTPPATHSPAIASARATGRLGSIVRTTPFWRITDRNLQAARLAPAARARARANGRSRPVLEPAPRADRALDAVCPARRADDLDAADAVVVAAQLFHRRAGVAAVVGVVRLHRGDCGAYAHL